MEKVVVPNRSLKLLRGADGVSPGPATTYRIAQYANLLAAQGSLVTAMSYLPSDSAQVSGGMWREHTISFSHLTLAEHFHVPGTMLNAEAPRINKIESLRRFTVSWGKIRCQ